VVQVKTFDISCSGYQLKADFYQGSKPNKILLSLIGWTSSRTKYKDILSGMVDQTGMSALVFDYSGHGDSLFDVADTRPAQHFLEVICVFDWIIEKYPEAEITVMGTSYGGFMATQLVKYREFKNLILRVPAIYRPQDFYDHPGVWAHTEVTNELRVDQDALRSHPLLKRASKFSGNALVVVHNQDEHVPVRTTDAYVSAFGADVLAFDAKHSPVDKSAEWKAEYQKQISDWLKPKIVQ